MAGCRRRSQRSVTEEVRPLGGGLAHQVEGGLVRPGARGSLPEVVVTLATSPLHAASSLHASCPSYGSLSGPQVRGPDTTWHHLTPPGKIWRHLAAPVMSWPGVHLLPLHGAAPAGAARHQLRPRAGGGGAHQHRSPSTSILHLHPPPPPASPSCNCTSTSRKFDVPRHFPGHHLWPSLHL